MEKKKLAIDGEWPRLEGKRLEALLVQECWYQKDLDEEANVVLIKVDEKWHHLYFDMGVLFCRTSRKEPHEGKPLKGAEISYRLRDLGVELGLAGLLIESCTARAVPVGALLELGFEGGKGISFSNVDNITSVVPSIS